MDVTVAPCARLLVVCMLLCSALLPCTKWDEPVGAARVFGASGWNRPITLPRLDPKFNVMKAKQEARDRIKEAHRKVGVASRGMSQPVVARSASGLRA